MNKDLCINNELIISNKLTFDEFANSGLFDNQTDNRFFWLNKLCTINNVGYKFKIGLCFRNSLLIRIELFCIDDKIKDEEERYEIHQQVVNQLLKQTDIQPDAITNTYDERGKYNSIIINYN